MKYLTILAITWMVFSGCSKKEDPAPADQRDQMTGNYSGTVEILDPDGKLIQTNSVRIQAGKRAGDQDRIDFFDRNDNNVMLMYGNKIKPVSNGIAFDIPYQPADGLNVEGAEGITVGSTTYDGAYFSQDKKLAIYVKLYNGSGSFIGYMEFQLLKE